MSCHLRALINLMMCRDENLFMKHVTKEVHCSSDLRVILNVLRCGNGYVDGWV
jgi:hypothetical protein